ncbi:MAG: ribosomal protein S18 acetylase RimI-like enzyme [Pseudomonadales bacterium]|jgi:ribosomal protein S18 acetylase RimI-like enzyme
MTDIERKIVISIGNNKDALRLSHLAAKLFHQAYADSMSADILASYIKESFTSSQQQAQLSDPNVTTLLVEIDQLLVGYAQLRLNPIPKTISLDISAQLWRIYIDKSSHGLGVGRQLLSRVGKIAYAMSHENIWLGVWEENLKAIAFYRQLGFKEVGSHEFHIGGEIQNDLVFAVSTSAL